MVNYVMPLAVRLAAQPEAKDLPVGDGPTSDAPPSPCVLARTVSTALGE